MGQDIPTFAAQTYDLFIDDGISSVTEINYTSALFPNPTSTFTTLKLSSVADVKIYNIIGEMFFDARDVKGEIKLSKSDLGVGIFYVAISSKNKEETLKLIIKQ